MADFNEIKRILDEVAKTYDILVTDLTWRNDSGNRVLEIPIQFNDGSMDLETCGLMSKLFIDALEDLEQLDFDYYLDVCSPGAEKILSGFDDIKKSLNEYVYVKLKDPKAGIHEIVGNLTEVDEKYINIEYKEKTRNKDFKIAMDNINLIRLAVKI